MSFLKKLFGKRNNRPVKHCFNFSVTLRPFGQKLQIKAVAMMPQESYTEAYLEVEEEIKKALVNPEISVTKTHLFRREKSWVKKQKV